MRFVVSLTVAFFIGILAVAWYASERAHPAFIDVDAAAVGAHRH
jgi:preprotein translocase subunit SecG